MVDFVSFGKWMTVIAEYFQLMAKALLLVILALYLAKRTAFFLAVDLKVILEADRI